MITTEQLRSIEFVSHSDGSRWCPACSYERCYGHAPDCWLDAAIIDSAVSGHTDAPVPAAPPDLVEIVREIQLAHRAVYKDGDEELPFQRVARAIYAAIDYPLPPN